LHPSKDFIRVIGREVARKWKMGNTKFLSEPLNRKDHLQDLGVDGKVKFVPLLKLSTTPWKHIRGVEV